MAENCDLTPSLDDVFDILSRVPEERLLSLWYKFNPDSSQASKAHCLLYSIISFLLKKKKEAERAVKSVLIKNSACRSAVHIYNRIQGVAVAGDGEKKPPGNSDEDLPVEDRKFLADLASMFAVLVEENLCGPSMRNRACQAVVKAVKSNKQDCNVELQELVEYYRLNFGFLDLGEEEISKISALKSIGDPNLSKVTTMAFKTNPVINPSESTTNSLSASEITLPSHFEISASPTVSFTTDLSLGNLNSSNPARFTTVGANNTNVSTSVNDLGRGKVISSMEDRRREVDDPEGSSGDKVNNVGPIKCSRKSGSDQIVTSKSKMLPCWSTGNGDCTSSISRDPSCEATNSRVNDPSNFFDNSSRKSSPSEESLTTMEESFEDTFYPFVVLHVPEDVEIAEDIRDKLESMGVKGTTIDDFSVPGQSPIKCIEDAINNSAFTILLLTNNFNTRWADYEANVTLMHSINNEHKYNTVVPMLPKKNSLQRDKIPFALRAIVSLNENSRHFEKHVKNTFKKTVLEDHKRGWLQHQRKKQIKYKSNQIQEDLRVTLETLSDQMKFIHLSTQLAEVQKCHFSQPMPLPHQGNAQDQPTLNPSPFSSFSLPPSCFNLPTPPVPVSQPYGNPLTSSPLPFAIPSISAGGQTVSVNNPMQQPGQGTNIIQIQHAKNVQIGDSNQMTITECTENRESTDDDEEEGGGNHSGYI
ncbi:splicing factor YJU2 isoform X1 [Narcine bancroftii]|uniref:splicing factor YJU2 isoform X1 n=1 Tax=Narcine bancroftii TaxID=1343680 RepID=UPI0038310D23